MRKLIKRILEKVKGQNSRDQILRDQYKEMLYLCLNAIDRNIHEEIANLTVQISIIHRRMQSLTSSTDIEEKNMRHNDKRAMFYEEAVYQRMEMKRLIESIQAHLLSKNNYLDSFLKEECKKPVEDSWIHCLTRFTPDKKYEPGRDYSALLYILSLLEADLSENCNDKLAPSRPLSNDLMRLPQEKIIQSKDP